MSLFNELKRRNVIRVGIAYVVVTWVLLQAIDFVLDIISAPNWVMQVFVLAAVAILPMVLIFSWVFEMTPEGIKRESEIDRNQSITPGTGRKLDRTIIIFLTLAVGLLLADRFMQSENTAQPAVPEIEIASSDASDERIKSIAVLPFVNMSSDPEQEYFSDGLSEELLNRLAKNDQLKVAARTSSFQFKGQNLDISNIGKQLNVAYVLEGSVRKSGNRLRITAQLIEVESGFHLWSETYEREIDDIFAIQDDISAAITKALEAELGTSTIEASQLTDNLDAYQLYLEARYLLAERGEANMLKAHDLFQQTAALDPSFAKAWSGMAYNYALLPAYGGIVSARQAQDVVQMAAGKALQLNPDNAEAYIALGRGSFYEDVNSNRRNFEKAFQLAPNNADVVNLYADFLVIIGDFEAAERLELKAIDLDPLAAVHYSDIAFVMYVMGRYEEGVAYSRTSARLAPDSIDRSDPLIYGLVRTGHYEEAMQHIRRLEQLPGSNDSIVNAWMCFLYYQQADEQNLRKKVNERVENMQSGSGEFGYALAAFYTAWLDGADAALPLLAKAYERQEWILTWPDFFYLPEDVSDDPDWLAFWQQPRLAELIELRRQNKTRDQVGYWKERQAQ